MPAHKILLNGGLVIVECLCLKKLVGRKGIMFFALPLKYKTPTVRLSAPLRNSENFSKRRWRNRENVSGHPGL